MIIYCLKCKQKIETIDYLEMKSSDGRNMIIDQRCLLHLWY